MRTRVQYYFFIIIIKPSSIIISHMLFINIDIFLYKTSSAKSIEITTKMTNKPIYNDSLCFGVVNAIWTYTRSQICLCFIANKIYFSRSFDFKISFGQSKWTTILEKIKPFERVFSIFEHLLGNFQDCLFNFDSLLQLNAVKIEKIWTNLSKSSIVF